MRNLKYLLVFLVAVSLFGQRTPVRDEFTYWKQTAGAEVITIQQPTTGSKDIFIGILNLYCSVVGIVELEKNGAAATATTATAIAVGREGAVATVTVWSGSNVGAGTKIDQFRLKADVPLSVDMQQMSMQGNGTGINYTLRSDCTGTGEYYIRWREE